MIGKIFKLFGFLLLFIVLFWASMAFLVVKGCQIVCDKGAKNIAAQVWEGTNSTPTTTPVESR